MAGGATNWESTETWQRVVAAIIASGVKLDLKAIATYVNPLDSTGPLNDTLENRFRKIKKDAVVLKAEVETGKRGEVAPRGKSAPTTPRKPKTPKKGALSSVANGRISKASPTKKRSIKAEQMESNASSVFDNVTDTNMGSFDESTLESFDNETQGLFGGGMDFLN
ncbi:hypothetical protein LTR36_009351 [Oleoguttula mirabilis]|uniref:Uncharacterized protein n=1 Tax=Oleoguttula mirabilis TaxID=1507867 RepID=A0AAV9JTN4_9PEZI|nr:hypothetical protein LTR36_009351 [Oleoguttula mirabilis]